MESPRVPRDMIFEILSQLSLRDIGRCRLVSKDFNKMTYESSFMQQNCQRTKTVSGCFVAGLSRGMPVSDFISINSLDWESELSLKFLRGPISIEAGTKQGLFLCTKNSQTRRHGIPEFYVCKPTTKEWRQIPNPKTRYFTEKLAMVVLRSKPSSYKIVRFSRHNSFYLKYNKSTSYYCSRCEIFDSETWTWKQLKDVSLPFDVFFPNEAAVCSCGVLYWLLTNNQVLAFYVDTETWMIFDLPFPLCGKNYFARMKLVDYKGRLGMLCVESDWNFMQIWVMEDDHMKIWSKKETTSLEALEKVGSGCCTPAAFDSSDILLMMGSVYRAVYYNFMNGRYMLKRLERTPIAITIFPFQSDSELVHLKNYRQKDQLGRTLWWFCFFFFVFVLVYCFF